MKHHTSVTGRTIGMLIIAAAATIYALTHCTPQPASAAVVSDPYGYKRCRFSEIQARICRVATWTEKRNGYTVQFRAYVRPLRKGERQS